MHNLTPATRKDMVKHYGEDQDAPDTNKKADYLASVLFNMLLQMTNGPANGICLEALHACAQMRTGAPPHASQ